MTRNHEVLRDNICLFKYLPPVEFQTISAWAGVCECKCECVCVYVGNTGERLLPVYHIPPHSSQIIYLCQGYWCPCGWLIGVSVRCWIRDAVFLYAMAFFNTGRGLSLAVCMFPCVFTLGMCVQRGWVSGWPWWGTPVPFWRLWFIDQARNKTFESVCMCVWVRVAWHVLSVWYEECVRECVCVCVCVFWFVCMV